MRTKLADERKEAIETPEIEQLEYDENSPRVSTGSTLLDLAISGDTFYEGGLPGGIFVEIFGPSGAGKTVVLCQIAGNLFKQGGKILFRDPEARLNAQFAKMFGMDIEEIIYDTPDTVTEVFEPIRKWKPEPDDKLHGVFIDSMAALSTDMEMDGTDKMGMRRAKEFSESMRKVCRVITQKGFLVVGSNQVRQNMDAGPYGEKEVSPGGKALAFYASVRLKCSNPKKLKVKKMFHGNEIERVVGVCTEITVAKNSVNKPYRSASITIIFDYGIDDVRDNLIYLKKMLGASTYILGGEKVGKSLEQAINHIELNNLEEALKAEVIEVWREIESQFDSKRKEKN